MIRFGKLTFLKTWVGKESDIVYTISVVMEIFGKYVEQMSCNNEIFHLFVVFYY